MNLLDQTWIWPVLFLAGLAAGFVDSIAGGGGLITLPVLLNLGIAPQEALGTNKLQATFGSAGAAFHYGKAGLVDWRDCGAGIACTAIGAILGGVVVLYIDPGFLKHFIPCFLVAIALYLLFRPQLGGQDNPPKLGSRLFHLCFGMGLGFYDGFFGPGTGSFWAMAYVLGMGFNLTKATAHTKVMNFASNFASLGVFLAMDRVLLAAGLVMGLGQLAGARLGSRAVITRGTRFIRPVFITVVLAITCKLIYDNFK